MSNCKPLDAQTFNDTVLRMLLSVSYPDIEDRFFSAEMNRFIWSDMEPVYVAAGITDFMSTCFEDIYEFTQNNIDLIRFHMI